RAAFADSRGLADSLSLSWNGARLSPVARPAASELRVNTQCCNTEISPSDRVERLHPTIHPNPMPARLSPSRHLRIGRSKTGLGLFACVAIKKGQFIIRYNGRKLTTEQADRLDNRYLFEVNARWTIDGSNRRDRARY